MIRLLAAAALLVALIIPVSTVADVRLPRILNSHMVMQRDADVKTWGWAEAGEQIRVSGDWFDGVRQVTADKRGRWMVQVRTGSAGGPHRLTIQGTNRIELTDILFGEVWIASGQSNMEMPLIKVSGAYTGIKNASQEVAAAAFPRVRLFQLDNFSSKTPLDDVEKGKSMYGIPLSDLRWKECSPRSIPTFSSTSYFFGRELHRRLNVPIGIIDASWGGTPAEAWTPVAGLKRLGLDAAVKQATQAAQKVDAKIPSRLYNGMIHPLRHLRVRGAVWYQGEGNVGRAAQYRALFSTMISEWRKVFGYDFSFYFVQIAPYRYGNRNSALLREAQLQTLSLPRTGMVVTLDIGDLRDIHPKNKQEVGRRLALWALARDYGRKVEYSGPLFKRVEFKGATAIVRFDHVGTGLATRDGKPPSHFEMAGSDKVFHPATATIAGKEVHVRCDKVDSPRAVRYAFSNMAEPNLINKAGLPASSFRTDQWR